MNRRPTSALRFLILLGALAVVSTGCSSDDDPMGPSNSTFAHASTVTADGLELTVSTRKATVEFGSDFVIRVELTNVSSETQVLDFNRGTPARYGNLAVNVNDTDDLNHFAQSDGERDDYPLAPGATLTSTFTWDQMSRTLRRQVDPGVFRVIATVGFDDRDLLQVRDLFVQID